MFDLVAAPNEDVLIRYLRDGLRLSIQVQFDERGWNLDTWDKAIENAIDAEAKASRQPLSGSREVDAQCLEGLRPVKNEKPTRLENKGLEKTKSSCSFPANLKAN